MNEGERSNQNDRKRWLVFGPNKSSHRQYKHFSKPGVVTIAGKPSDDIRKGTENSIIKQAGLK